MLPTIKASSLADPLGRYYTREKVSEVLVSYLSVQNPETVLDLGSGDGSLTKAVAKKWSRAQYITVDIDKSTSLNHQPTLSNNFIHKHFLTDALEPALISDIGLSPESIDLAICNPPFIKPRWQKKHHDFLLGAGLPKEIIGIKELSAEVIFIVQSLVSLRPGGQLGLIIPDGFISGERNTKFRQFILESNAIEKVVKLPTNAFVGTSVQAHIVIITKGGASDTISLEEIRLSGEQAKEVVISKNEGIESLDYSYHSEKKTQTQGCMTLSDLGCTVSRGKSNSRQCRESQQRIFHTVDFKLGVKRMNLESFSLITESQKTKHVIAGKGDIIIARVGRNLTKKICIVSTGNAPISDCIYRLEVPVKYRKSVHNFLVSKKGRAALQSRTHGTGARYLTVERLLGLPITNIKR
ncbi:MAG: type I restriction enzyme M protein [Oleiphilaceae bacterium]|jgi:type I restriction enzyme M protein